MQEENTIDRDITEYRFERLVPQFFKTPATQLESEKVPNTGGTFLNEDSDGLQIPITEILEKVTNTVGTFWKEHSNGFQTSTTKVKPEKVPDMVGTF